MQNTRDLPCRFDSPYLEKKWEVLFRTTHTSIKANTIQPVVSSSDMDASVDQIRTCVFSTACRARMMVGDT